jgi:hypothetical protein
MLPIETTHSNKVENVCQYKTGIMTKVTENGGIVAVRQNTFSRKARFSP